MDVPPPPPPDLAPASDELPAPLAHLWETFARRELGRGRRDISNLVEATLQFILENETKSLAPMVATLELIHSWVQALTAELQAVRRLAAQHPKALPTPYPLMRITMVRADSGVQSLSRESAGEPATHAAQLLAFAQSLEKQLVLVQQAQDTHTQALQARRHNLAETLRRHAALMHASATDIIATLPPPPTPAGDGPDAAPQDAPQAPEAGAQAPARRTLRDLLQAPAALRRIDWRALSPLALARACAQALVRGYQAPVDPDLPPEVETPAMPPAARPKGGRGAADGRRPPPNKPT